MAIIFLNPSTQKALGSVSEIDECVSRIQELLDAQFVELPASQSWLCVLFTWFTPRKKPDSEDSNVRAGDEF